MNQTKRVHNGGFRTVHLGKHPNGTGNDLIKVFAGTILIGFASSEEEAIQLYNSTLIEG
ncbi:MAG: hypothetical protein ABS939_19850 [Psychrobacillus sp.]